MQNSDIVDSFSSHAMQVLATLCAANACLIMITMHMLVLLRYIGTPVSTAQHSAAQGTTLTPQCKLTRSLAMLCYWAQGYKL